MTVANSIDNLLNEVKALHQRLVNAISNMITYKDKSLKNLNPQDLCELAKFIARKDPTSANYFHKLQIKNPDYQFEIGKILAKKNIACNVLEDFVQFKRLKEEQRLELANMYALSSTRHFLLDIKSFRITDQAALFDLAKYVHYKMDL